MFRLVASEESGNFERQPVVSSKDALDRRAALCVAALSRVSRNGTPMDESVQSGGDRELIGVLPMIKVQDTQDVASEANKG